jgi:hypothetical protein
LSSLRLPSSSPPVWSQFVEGHNPGRGGVKDNPSLLDVIVFHTMALETVFVRQQGPSFRAFDRPFSQLFLPLVCVLGIRLMNWICQSHLWPSFDLARFLQSWHQGFGWLTKHEAVTCLPIMGLDESRGLTLLSKDQFNHHRPETWSMVLAEAMANGDALGIGSKGGTASAIQ